MTPREIVVKHLGEHRAAVAALEEILADLDAEDELRAAAAAGESDEELAEQERDPRPASAKAKKSGKGGGRQPGQAARKNAPAVAKALALADGPMSYAALLKATGYSSAKLMKVVNTFGPSANGSAYFSRDDAKRYMLTPLGEKELPGGDDA